MADHSISPRKGNPKGGHKERNYTIDQYGVTKQQNAFVREYIRDYNATAAAIRAKYSARSARSQASALLTKPNIQQAVEREEKTLQNRFFATKEKILKELALIGFSDLSEYITVNEYGEVLVKDITNLPPQISRALKAVKTKTDSRESSDGETRFKKSQVEVTLHDKIEALNLMGKHLGMFKDKCELTGPDGGPIKVESLTDDELIAIIAAGKRGKGA